MIPTGDPAAMLAAAARLRMRAERIDAVSASLGSRVAAMVYAGPAADRFRSSMTDRNGRARTVAAQLYELADTLTRAAGQLETAQLEQAALARAAEEGAL